MQWHPLVFNVYLYNIMTYGDLKHYGKGDWSNEYQLKCQSLSNLDMPQYNAVAPPCV